ncbi:MAG: NADP-dependent oxidoreductase [Zetaproteobacteria bacterium]|nr:NADP-dependent oxidoreductase [Pseudobdellovibrionaceae bacterium]
MKSSQLQLCSRPEGHPSAENFSMVHVDLPELKEGQILVRNEFLTVDPYMRGRMNNVKSYVPPFELNQPLEGGAVGFVVESKNSAFKVGEPVLSGFGWRDLWVAEPKGVISLKNMEDYPLSWALGTLGMPGLTAWSGLHKVGALQPNETVFVSGAAGAVGSIVGQLAKAHGARVIGSAGSQAKVDWLKEIGFDEVINYQKQPIRKALAEVTAKGIDLYFDNVGGSHLEAAIDRMNVKGRIVLCGAIEQYNQLERPSGPDNMIMIVGKQLSLKGFIVSSYNTYHNQFQEDVRGLIGKGQVTVQETVSEGLDQMVNAFLGLFSGHNTGKAIVKLSLN